MQSIPTKNSAAAKTSFLQSILTDTCALILFHGTGYVSSCIKERRFHAKLRWKTGSWIKVAAQLAKSAWSALSKSVDLENCQTVSRSSLIYDSGTVLLHAPMSRKDGFSTRSQREPLNGAERPVTTEEIDVAALERSGAVDHTMCLFNLQFFSHPHALLGSNTLYIFKDDKHLEKNAVKQL